MYWGKHDQINDMFLVQEKSLIMYKVVNALASNMIGRHTSIITLTPIMVFLFLQYQHWS